MGAVMYGLSSLRSTIQKLGEFVPGTSSVLLMVAELIVNVFLVKKAIGIKKRSSKKIKVKKDI